MKTFHLYERPCGRVVIAEKKEKESRLLREIKAESWKAARATIKEDEFFHDHGHGYFLNPLPGAYQRQRERDARISAERLRMMSLFAGLNETAIRPKKGKRETLEV